MELDKKSLLGTALGARHMPDSYSHDLLACRDAWAVAGCLLQKGMAVTGAPMGNVQLLNRTQTVLEIAVQSGFRKGFLDFFRAVESDGQSVCARAFRRGEVVAVEDVAAEKLPQDYHTVFAEAEVRAVQSVPLIASDGTLIGMLSTHFREPVKLGADELLQLRRHATLAANRLVLMRAQEGDRPNGEPLQVRRGPSKESRRAWSKLLTDE